MTTATIAANTTKQPPSTKAHQWDAPIADLSASQRAALSDRFSRVFVSFSGGIDSAAAAVMAAERFDAKRIILVFCDTGREHPETYAYCKLFSREIHPIVRLAQRRTEAGVLENVFLSWDEPVGARGAITLADMIETRLERKPDSPGWPSAKNRFCTRGLKIQPFDKYLRHQVPHTERDTALTVKGIRRDESLNRAGAFEFEPRYVFSARDPQLALPGMETERKLDKFNETPIWCPIVTWTREQAVTYLKSWGVPINPVYEYSPRSNCVDCFYAAPRTIQATHQRHGDIYQWDIEFEQRTGRKWTAEISITEILESAERADDPLPLFENPFKCDDGFCDV